MARAGSGHFSDNFRDFALRRAAEIAGALLLAGAAALALALVSWSARDPSFNHATDGRVRNLLGAPGAIVADLMMQLVGVATIALLLPLAAQGWRLMTRRALDRWRTRFFLLFLGALFAAATAALLPVTDRWPLPTGLGGVVGDAMLALPRHATNGSALAMAAVGLLYAGAAIITLSAAVGLAFESEDDIRDESFERAQRGDARHFADDESDFEPGLALTALGALYHCGRALKNGFVRGVAVAFRRKEAEDAGEDATSAAPPAARRREPIFDEFEDFSPVQAGSGQAAHDPARATPAAPRPASDAARRPARERPQPAPATRRPAAQGYAPPALALLAEAKKPAINPKLSEDAAEQNARILEGVLDDFSVRGEIINVRPGPVVTLYELEPAPGIKSSRVIGLADDIARSMSAVSARVAVVPGRNAIGIELPNQRREMVYLRELLACEDFAASKHKLAIALGKTIGGEPVIVDLARMPHLLVAGTTGSGKSVAINTMILSLLYRLKPEECRLIMVDPKMLELSVYDNIPHLLTPVVTDPKKAVVALKWAVR